MLLLFISHVLLALIDWLIFKGFFDFFIVHCLQLGADQSLYSLSLIKRCSARVKQNTAVKAAIDPFLLLMK